VSIPLSLDMSGVTVGGQPVGVGGYVLRVTYDTQRVAITGVSPAPASPFPEAPVFTDPSSAASTGVLRIVSALPLRVGALGVVPLGVIQVQERVPGAAAQVQIQVEQLASGLTDYGVLPISASVSR
jgi:hypothetical protein